MTIESFQFVLPLALLLVSFAAFLVYLLIKVPSSYWVKWLGVPIFLITSFFSYNVYTSKFGQPMPVEALPDQEFVLLGGRIIGTKTIELWILEGRTTSRLIRIPYEAKTAKQLQKALDRANKGVTQMGKGKGKGKGTGKNSGGELVGKDGKDKKGPQRDTRDTNDEDAFYDYPHAREMPKPDDPEAQ